MSETPAPPLCQDCRHIDAESRTCLNPLGGQEVTDVVDGTTRTLFPSVDYARSPGVGRCGPEGTLWQAIVS
jgi:hypothetical protein